MTMAYARKRAGLLQRQVAEALGVSMGTVAMWDTGKNKPRANMLPKIAKIGAFRVNPNAFGDHVNNVSCGITSSLKKAVCPVLQVKNPNHTFSCYVFVTRVSSLLTVFVCLEEFCFDFNSRFIVSHI